MKTGYNYILIRKRWLWPSWYPSSTQTICIWSYLEGPVTERMKPMNSVKVTGSTSCAHLGKGGASRQTDSHHYQIQQIWEKYADITGKYNAINVLIYWTDTAVPVQTSSCEKRQNPANAVQRITGHHTFFFFFLNLWYAVAVQKNMPKH